jgi:Gpi18-like mannosyltransferase
VLIWLVVHLGYIMVMVLMVMINNKHISLDEAWMTWFRWDTEWFVGITETGYTGAAPDRIDPSTAFFPLFPLLAWLIDPITPGDAFIAVMVVANVAFLATLVLVQRLFEDESDAPSALRGTWYLAIFPAGFFLAAGYNLSLALALSVAALSAIRRHNWWLAGLLGALASANRSSGILLLVPFGYEYLSARGFRWRKIRPDVLFAALIPTGLLGYMIYTWIALDDPLQFMHAQVNWDRTLSWPWQTMWESTAMAFDHLTRLNAFQIHNLIDLVSVLLVEAMLVLSFAGPWKLRRDQWALPLYGLAVWVFITIFPDITSQQPAPLKSSVRLVLEAFPAFLILGRIGRHQSVDKIYTCLAIGLQALLLFVFLRGDWVA